MVDCQERGGKPLHTCELLILFIGQGLTYSTTTLPYLISFPYFRVYCHHPRSMSTFSHASLYIAIGSICNFFIDLVLGCGSDGCRKQLSLTDMTPIVNEASFQSVVPIVPMSCFVLLGLMPMYSSPSHYGCCSFRILDEPKVIIIVFLFST